jgi:hypothetical protein
MPRGSTCGICYPDRYDLLRSNPVILTDEICEFVTGGVSILLASRNAALMPSVARATGCRALRDERETLRLIISATQAGQLLEDVRESGMISATFTLPKTHRTLQFKGNDAHIASIDAMDRVAIDAYRQAFATVIWPLGFADRFAQAFLATPADEVAIEFTPAEAFQQTPGPAAGARIA